VTSSPAQGSSALARLRGRTVLLNQLLLSAMMLLGVLLTLLYGSIDDTPKLTIGVLLTFAAMGTAFAVRWTQAPAGMMLVLPIADILAIALLVAAAPGSGFAVLWVFPAMWMGSVLDALGAVLATALIAGTYWIIRLTDFGGTFTPAVVMLSVAAAGVAALASSTARRASAQRAVLERQSRYLQLTGDRSRQQEDIVTDVLDAVDFGVIRFTETGEKIVVNDAQSRLQRRASAASAVFAADGLTLLEDAKLPLTRARRGETFENELVWYGEPGAAERRALRSTSRRVVSKELSPDGMLVVTRDVTEEELALRARQDLVASVSHELRTPLTSITGHLDLALEDPALPARVRQSLEVVERNADRLLELISDLLTASAISRRGVELQMSLQSTELAALIETSVEALRPRAVERDIAIDLADLQPITAVVDPGRMRQVIDNVVSNAIKYNSHGGMIEIAAAQSGGNAWIWVHDEGSGIPENELPRVFERFYRAKQVRNSTVHGSGLGLAISREIIRAHGGSITIRSTVGEGTAVMIRIPVDGEGVAGE
jgi:signal transduction histidine kinase